MATYYTKDEIFRDYEVAIKFGLSADAYASDYDELYKVFRADYRAKLEEMTHELSGLNASACFIVEVPVDGDAGESIGTRVILLQHESGWEIFIPLLAAFATWLAERAVDVAAEKVLEGGLKKMLSFFKDRWNAICRPGIRITYVEVRTKNKGTLRLPFGKFEIAQVLCLLQRFPKIKHISECNASCFGGQLVDPPQR